MFKFVISGDVFVLLLLIPDLFFSFEVSEKKRKKSKDGIVISWLFKFINCINSGHNDS